MKSDKMCISAVLSCVFALVSSMQADTYLWNRGWRWPSNAPFSWSDYPKWWWNETTGAAGTVAPGASADAADIVALTNNPFMKQVFRVGTSSAAGDVTLKSISGFADKSISFPARSADYYEYLHHRFTVADPTGFGGFFITEDSGVEIVLSASAAEESPILSNIITTNRVTVSVTDAGTSAMLRSLQGGGALDKKGSGTLVMASPGGLDTKIYVKEGTLTLNGSSGDIDSPAPGALYHFDASRLDTMTYEIDGDRTNVTRWASLGDTGMYAYRPTNLTGTGSRRIHFANAPFISSEVSPTGLPLMDFGSNTEDGVSEYGPTNCVFGLSYVGTVDNIVSHIGSANVREVFYAGCRSHESQTTLFSSYNEGEHHYLSGGSVNSGAHKLRYDESSASPHVLRGSHWLNGCATDNNVTLSGVSELDFHVYGCAATGNTAVRYLAADRLYPNRIGGWRVGEILIYTNVLTAAERDRVNRYLVKKWLGSDDCDAGAVIVAGEADSLGVSDGNVAKVRRVVAESGTLVKSGGGRLEVDHLHPANLSLEVQGGEVAVTSGNSPVSADPQVASGAYLWLEAGYGITATNAPGDTVDQVIKWSDRRGEGYDVYAEVPVDSSSFSGLPPYVVPGAVNGRDIVSFIHGGQNGSEYQSWMRVVPSGKNGYEAFIALRVVNRYSASTIFGSTTYDLRGTFHDLLNKTSAGAQTPSALWMKDGAPCDPWTDGFPGRDGFHVYSVSLASKHAFDLLAKTTLISDTGVGRIEIGEFIVYDRRLTDAERRDTIACLMKKWKGTESPEAKGKLRLQSLAFSTAAKPVLESDDDVTVNDLSGVSGRALVKRGTGTVTVRGSREGLSVSSISVEGGELVFDPTPNPSGEALFHFDAADIPTLSYYVTDGGSRTNVKTWADCRENGILAESFINDTTPQTSSSGPVCFTNATLQTVETAAGVFRTVVDFGQRSNNVNVDKGDDSAGMKISGVAAGAVRELHVVWADAHAAETGRYADMATSSGNEIDYYRYGTKLIRADSCTKVAGGRLWADGEKIDASFQPGTSAHLLSSVPTDGTTVTSMFLDRTSNAGGGWYGELIAFSNALSDVERDFLMRRLRAKWFGTAEPVWTNDIAYTSIDVANGASLDFTRNAFVHADSVTGTGTLKAAGFMPGAITLEYRGAGDIDRMHFAGEVVFGENAEVSVSVASSAVVETGAYTILTADSFSGAKPKLTAEGFGRKKTYLNILDGRIDLVVADPGLRVLIK